MKKYNATFIGRSNELEKLNALRSKKTASLVVIQGRRRIGKSRLIQEFCKKSGKKMDAFYIFSGIPPTSATTIESQHQIFLNQMHQQGFPKISANDWSDIFLLLSQQTSHKKTIILFDEISWMGSKDPDFLGKLKNAWDLYFKNNPHLILILCGSVSSWIEENILMSTGFVGRISLALTLHELSLQQCCLFLEKIGYQGSVEDILKILSVTGGIPKYLEEIQSEYSAEENIKQLCFESSGLLFREFNDLFSDLFSKKMAVYKKIVEYLAQGPAELNDICQDLSIKKSGRLSKNLNILIKSGFIKRDYTWNLRTGKEARLSHYRLSDNYLRFYLKYVDKNKGRIENGQFTERSITTLPGWESMMGLQFENLVLNNRALIWNALKIYPEDIIIDNPFFQRKTIQSSGCQIDYLIQTSTNTLYVCEIKFSKNPLSIQIIDEMQEKIKRLQLPRGFSCVPVLIHVNGIQNTVDDAQYFKKIIDFSEFLTYA